MKDRAWNVKGMGWVLPWGTGSGLDLLARAEDEGWSAEANAGLEKFSARDYLVTVKGYLDPASAMSLAAASLALKGLARAPAGAPMERAGVAASTLHGAPHSGWRFYEQVIHKGPRLASPLLFPQSYANTAPSLIAIEFGLGGPHMVFFGTADVRAAWDFAAARLSDGTAGDMLVLVSEAVFAGSSPAAGSVLNGAVALWLSRRSDVPTLFPAEESFAPSAFGDEGAEGEKGTVHAMLKALRSLATGG